MTAGRDRTVRKPVLTTGSPSPDSGRRRLFAIGAAILANPVNTDGVCEALFADAVHFVRITMRTKLFPVGAPAEPLFAFSTVITVEKMRNEPVPEQGFSLS